MTYESPDLDATDGTHTLPGLVECLALGKHSVKRTKTGMLVQLANKATPNRFARECL